MPTLLKNQSVIKDFDPDQISGSGTAVVTNTSSFFFYSNDPESIGFSDLADKGKFLNRVTVTGKGQVYTWHANITGQTIKNCLLIYNPNSYAIQVKVLKSGTTNTPRNDVSDSEAWKNYFTNGQQRTITIAAAGYSNLFLTDIVNNGRFGMIAELDIKKVVRLLLQL